MKRIVIDLIEDNKEEQTGSKKRRLDDDETVSLATTPSPSASSPSLPYYFISPMEISDVGFLTTMWSPSSTPEAQVIEEALHHAVKLRQQGDEDGVDCWVGTFLCAINMLQCKEQDRKQNKRLLALVKKHWPQLLEVRDFGEWSEPGEMLNDFCSVRAITCYMEDPY